MSTPPPIPPRPAPRTPPPRRRMNGCLIALIIAGVLAVPTIAMLAAIALPAYQDYVMRSKVMQSLHYAKSLEPDVEQYFKANGSCPDNNAIGLENDTVDLGVASGDRTPRATITIGAVENGRCVIEMRYTDLRPAVDGKTLVFELNEEQWQCHGGSMPQQYRPLECRTSSTTE